MFPLMDVFLFLLMLGFCFLFVSVVSAPATSVSVNMEAAIENQLMLVMSITYSSYAYLLFTCHYFCGREISWGGKSHTPYAQTQAPLNH